MLEKLFRKKQILHVPTYMSREEMLNGKTAVITGASGGIGEEIARAFVRHGCRVILCGRNQQKLQELSSQLEKAEILCFDIRDYSSVTAAFNSLLSKEMRIDILVNAAGVTQKAGFGNVDEQEYDLIMDTNLKGTYFISQQIAKHMINNNIRGNILNITSSSSNKPASGPYAMSKWAMKGLTIGLAEQLIPYGITVNAIAPGKTATHMLNKSANDDLFCADQPCGRYVLPQEIAEMAVVLTSDMGRMVVGDTVYVSGGNGITQI